MPRPQISCFIIAKNEADRIGRTIGAVKDLVDEVIVVDSGSSDGTQDAAARAGARVVFNAWPGFGQQKRFAEEQCRGPWLINLDADEVLSPALVAEIRQLFAAGEPPLAAYRLRINNVYPGRSRPRLWANDHVVVRLYDRRRVRFKDSTLHDSVDTGAERVKTLRGEVYHFSMRSFDEMVQKADERMRYNADHAKKKPLWQLRLRVIFEFPAAFLRYYFVRRHFTGGLLGFETSVVGAYSRFIRIARMIEAQRNPSTIDDRAADGAALNERRRP
ncbi:MAG: glycosyltransferase family 2 protein [Alphaproteobacteria bacterium]|nr:glycosyltransferase family 2 protein [Alphaproteobacteria bacterium]